MELVIAEKPSVARDLARVLGVPASGRHAFEGERYVITWCVGHLVELEEPVAYNPAWKAWRLDRLPMLPEQFKLRGAKHALPQLKVVSSLLRERFESVINACDAGREGELIFRYVYQHANSRLPVRRLWISSLTDDAIRRGFAALRPGRDYQPLADAARSRSEADWLVGMNATRAITARGREAGRDALYSIGRVQTPTLAMLVERERQIRAFVPRDYWEVTAALRTASGAAFVARWRHEKAVRLGAAALADEIVGRDAAGPAPVVERVRSRTVKEPPPQLFDLTTLQRTANRRFGFSAQRTLEIAQALYERHKVITYPRTDSRHLSADVAAELAPVFGALVGVPAYAPFAQHLLDHPPRPGRRVVDDARVSDHHAIIPTSKRPGALDRDETRLFDLIARRFLGAFYPDAEIAVTEAWIRVGLAAGAVPTGAADKDQILEALPPLPDRYLARGRVRLVAGWQEVAGISAEGPRRAPDDTDDDEREPTAILPVLAEGEVLSGAYASAAKQTTPPPRYTEATLLGAMESAGKAIDDEALRAAMKDTGLGTPATRASIIETLLRRDYIERDHKWLVPTPTGIGLIAAIPVPSLASPELTGGWEARLAAIARGADSRAAFMADIARYVTDVVDAIRGGAPASPSGGGAMAPGGGPMVPSGGPMAPGGGAMAARLPPGGLAPQRDGAAPGQAGPAERFAPPNRAWPADGPRDPAGPAERFAPPSRAWPADGPRDPAGPAERFAPPSGEAMAPSGAMASGGLAPPSRAWPADGPRDPVGPADWFAPPNGAWPADGPRDPVGPADWFAPPSRAWTADGPRDPAGPAERFAPRARPGGAPLPDKRDVGRVVELPSPGARTASIAGGESGPGAKRHRDPARTAGWASLRPAKAKRASAAKARRGGRTADAAPRSATAEKSAKRAAKPKAVAARTVAPKIAKGQSPTSEALPCPRCHRGTLITGGRGWGCSRYAEGCGFVVWFETAGRRLTPAQLSDLITKGKTRKAAFERGVGRLVLDAGITGGARFEPG